MSELLRIFFRPVLTASLLSATLAGCAFIEKDTAGPHPVSAEVLKKANREPLAIRRVMQRRSALLDSLPVGSVIAYLPIAGVRLPESWRYANGDTVDDPRSPLFGRALPNLMDERFLMGTIDSAGNVGGSNAIASDGAHDHGGTTEYREELGETGPPTRSADIARVAPGAMEIRITPQGHKHVLEGHVHQIGEDGIHDHGGDNRPAWAGVLFIVRIK